MFAWTPRAGRLARILQQVEESARPRAPLVELVERVARTMRVIRRNIAFSIVYNIMGATLAVTGTINSLIAAILMPASSLTVVVASWRSRTFPRVRLDSGVGAGGV